MTSSGKSESGHHLLFCARKHCAEDDEIDLSTLSQEELLDHQQQKAEHFNCGTKTSINDTHLTYENQVLLPGFESEKSETEVEMFQFKVLNSITTSLPFICSWKRDLYKSMSVNWSPESAIIKAVYFDLNTSGRGKFSLVMRMYQSNRFQNYYQAPPVIKQSDLIYLGVELEHTDFQDTNLFPVIQHVWFSNTPDPFPNESTYVTMLGGCSIRLWGDVTSGKVGYKFSSNTTPKSNPLSNKTTRILNPTDNGKMEIKIQLK